jgi:glucose/arabinose dehydrogenase
VLRAKTLTLATIVWSVARCCVSQEVTMTPIVSRLTRPSGVAVRPDGALNQYEVYFSDLTDQQIKLFRSDAPQNVSAAITNFPAAEPGGPTGPSALLFVSRQRLVVGLAGNAANSNLLLFELKDDTPLTADQAVQKLPIGEAGESKSEAALGVHALARTLANDRVPDLLIATTHGASPQAGVWKIPLRAGTLDKPTLFAATNQAARPSAVAISKHGYVVVSHSNTDGTKGSRLAYGNPIDSSKVMELAVPLEGIRGLAYSPQTGNLYAASYGSEEPDSVPQGSGIFRIEDASKPGQPAARAVKVADVLRPTALAFAPDGALYVTADGNIQARGSRNGFLVKLSSGL